MPQAALATTPSPISFLLHPRRIWWRRLLVQVHLWVGLVATLYICLVGVTGSLLVFQKQLYQISRPQFFRSLSPVPQNLTPLIPVYLERAARAFPDVRFTGIYMPRADQAVVQMEGERIHPRHFNDFVLAYLDPASGRVLGSTDSRFWVAAVRELHVRLLSGRTGAIVNGCGAFCLLAMCLTGIVIWWRGLKTWTRALRVDFRRKLPRVNFDLHSAVGFWALLLLLMWSVSGIYFTWPDRFVAFLDRFTPAKAANYPQIEITPPTPITQATIPVMIREADRQSKSPLLAVEFPTESTSPLVVITGEKTTVDRSTYQFFNPYTGQLIRTWEHAPGPTLGTKLIFWLAPLHFGESWGLILQSIWSMFGLTLPVLAITGAIMYWNRYLSKKFSRPTRRAEGIIGSITGAQGVTGATEALNTPARR